jgi:hypothetical protein
VQSIVSVSGGSILNAFVALLKTVEGKERSFRCFGPGEFHEHAAKLAAILSGNRRMFFASGIAGAFGTGLVFVLFLLQAIDGWTTLLTLSLICAGISFFLGPRSGGSLWGWWGTWLYCSAIILAAAGVAVTGRSIGIAGTKTPLILLACGWLLHQRHWVAEHAFSHTICRIKGKNKSPTLEKMNSDVKHIFCATEMHSGQHAYFSHDFVYARGFGLGSPACLPVAAALQVSANFPGGFPIRRFNARRFHFSLTDRYEEAIEQGHGMGRDILHRDEDTAWAVAHQQFAATRPLPQTLLLTDGGVFDNLAVDWYLENKARLSRFQMSLNWDWDVDRGDWVHGKENRHDKAMLSPLKDTPECLMIVNSGVTAHWRHSTSILSIPVIGEIAGLLNISTTMYNNNTKTRIRGLDDHVVIEMGFSERLVRTTLLPLGEKVTARLLEAGYYAARYAANQRFGHPLGNVDTENFQRLAQGKHRPQMAQPNLGTATPKH